MKRISMVLLAPVLLGLAIAGPSFAGGESDTATQTTSEAEVMVSEGRPAAAGNYQIWATPADYESSTGSRIASFGESPLLAARVAAGELPPVDQRLPREPLVVRGFDGRIGTYGGVLTEYNVWDSAGNAPQLVWTRMPINGYWPLYEPYPAIIKSFEMAKDDGTEWVFVLREGLKWSDGQPLTADDFLFPFNDVAMNAELTPRSWPELKSGDATATIAKESDYQVRYSFPQPYRFTHINPWFRWYIPNPSHYLKQFHADYVAQDALDKLVKEGGFETWIQLYSNRFADSNIDRPTVKPWMLSQPPPAVPVINTRNPYFWAIDEQGNQLPYVDELRFLLFDQEVLNLKALAGEVGYSNNIGLALYPELKKAEQEGKIKLILNTGADVNTNTIQFNLNHDDPVMREIFQDARFRHAISYAIEREVINEVIWLGLLEPAQVGPRPGNPFYHEELINKAVDFDQDRANALLDEIGLDQRGADGFRLRPDGKPLLISFMLAEWDVKFGELATDMIKDVGINSNLRVVELGALMDVRNANRYDAAFIWTSWGTTEGRYMDGNVAHLISTGASNFWSPKWANWHLSGGAEGEQPHELMMEAIEYYSKAQSSMDLEEQQLWFKKVLDIAADNLWTIGILAPQTGVTVTLPNLVNYPATQAAWDMGDSGVMAAWFLETE